MLNTLSNSEQIDNIFDVINTYIPQNTLIACPDWAEDNRYMDSKITGRSGQFSFKNAPYCKEICECFSKNNPIQQVAIMKGVQLGLTTSVIENVIGYTIDVCPSPMMFSRMRMSVNLIKKQRLTTWLIIRACVKRLLLKPITVTREERATRHYY